MIFAHLNKTINDTNDLNAYLASNLPEVYDLYNGDYNVILREQEAIEEFILTKRAVAYEGLNFDLNYNKAFLSLLVDFATRLGFSFCIHQLVNVIHRQNLTLGSRLEAGVEYLLAPSNKKLLECFSSVCHKLSTALIEEEETLQKTLISFANYYGKVVRDTSTLFIHQFLEQVHTCKNNDKGHFLHHPFIDGLLQINPFELASSYSYVQDLVEHYLGRPSLQHSSATILQMEFGTTYSIALGVGPYNFQKNI